MGVIVSHRNESRFEVLAHAVEMRNKLTELSVRGFGIRNLERLARKKYASGKDKTESVSKYVFLLSGHKNRFDFLSAQVVGYTRAANAIFPRSLSECDLRREYQDRALVACEQLIGEMQQIVEVFDVDLNCYKQYVDVIDREIGLIKSWRQSDNRLRAALS